MRIARLDRPQVSLEQDLPGRRRQQVGATDDVGDALVAVVDDYRELVSPVAVGATDHEIADFTRQLLSLSALDPIDERDGNVVDAKSPRAARLPSPTIRRGPVATGARIDPISADTDRCVGEITARARALESEPTVDQCLQRRCIGIATRALVENRTIPFEAVAVEDDGKGRRGHLRFARRIEILDPEQPATAIEACIGMTCHRGDQRTEVQGTGGGGRKAPEVRAGVQCVWS